jgi:SPP1 gp7 family putative phage head morphogenesis protein
MQSLRAKLVRIRREYVAAIDRFKPVLAINAKYAYRLDQATLEAVLAGLDGYVDSVLLDGGVNQLWFFNDYVRVAYERGTLQEFINLSRQSPAYTTARESMINLIRSEPYQTRIALIRAREFEEMKGLSGGVKADMSRVLTDGLARGLPPNEIAVNLKQQTGIEINRANRIARTEIPTALRRARMDEADDARETLALRTMEMHLSALSPTTRVTHAQRHGKLFTTDQQRQWWSEGANSINCKCSTVSVMVDAKGEPLIPDFVENARASFKHQAEKEGMPWAKDL